MSLRPIHVASLLLLATLVLAGCRTVPFEPPIEATVVAQVVEHAQLGDLVPVLVGEILEPAAEFYYRIEAPDARALVYAEVVGDDLRVTLYDLRGRVQGVSIDPDRFGRSAVAGGDPSAIEPSALSVQYACDGPCVAAAGNLGSYIVRIENRAGSERAFDLYAYTMDPTDTNEPNDSSGSATIVHAQDRYEGAIERIGDVDYFRYTGDQTRLVTFDAFSDPMGLVLEIEDGPTLASGQSAFMLPDEIFRVRSQSSRAGPSTTSGYFVTVGAVTSPTLHGTVEARSTASELLVDDVPAGTSRWYRVRVPIAGDLLYAEVTAVGGAQPVDLRLRITRRDGATLVVSQSPSYFADEVSGLAAADGVAAAAVGPSATLPQRVCVGPCAAVAPTRDTYYVRVENTSGVQRRFALRAYAVEAADPSDRGGRQNDSAGFAVDLNVDPSGRFGAIELVGDADWFRYRGAADDVVSFFENEGAGVLALRLRFESDGFILRSGESAIVRPNERFVVYSSAGRAGPAGSSGYIVLIGAP